MAGNTLETEACMWCGGIFPKMEGALHPYLESTTGCWNAHGELTAKVTDGEFAYSPYNHLLVDTYCVQHPGQPERRAIQSVAVHLISLYYLMEKEQSPAYAVDTLRKAVSFKDYHWLKPPDLHGLTIADVLKAETLEQHKALTLAWAQDVWGRWYGMYPEVIRTWAERV